MQAVSDPLFNFELKRLYLPRQWLQAMSLEPLLIGSRNDSIFVTAAALGVLLLW